MRLGSAGLLVLLLGVHGTAHADKPVRIAQQPLEVGQGGAISEEVSMDVHLRGEGEGVGIEMDTRMVHHKDRRFVVRERSEAGPTRVEVHYERCDLTMHVFGMEQSVPTSLSGRTYIVHYAPDKVAFSRVDGDADGPITDEELQVLQEDQDFLSRLGLDAPESDAKPYAMGTPLQALEPRGTHISVDIEGVAPRGVLTGTRREAERSVAVWGWALGTEEAPAQLDEGQMALSFHGQGELWIDTARGHVAGWTFSGPLESAASEGPMGVMRGTGTIAMRGRVTVDASP